MISDAAKQVKVEAHVLRYWEEELGLPIKRNELGHRYYTVEDVERFREIKDLKERGLQLKAIRMVLKNGKLDMITSEIELASGNQINTDKNPEKNLISDVKKNIGQPHVLAVNTEDQIETKEEKAQRLQWLLQQLFRDTLQENNKELCRIIKEGMLKEMDYQFRVQEEREDERHSERIKQEEEHFKKIDELLRKKRRLLRK